MSDATLTDAVVIGGGQAGLATSYWLARRGVDHVVLEAGDVAQSWRERWRSLMLVSPNFLNRLPGHPYEGDNPDGFLSRDETIDYLAHYAETIDAPLRTHTRVKRVARSGTGFLVETDWDEIRARAVVVATGAHQRPHIPAVASEIPASIQQLHADRYGEPAQLARGPVLVVGGGQAGSQIALELLESGRRVFLSAGRCAWYPRRLYDRDILWWRDQMGEFDVATDDLPDPAAARIACTPLTRAGTEDFNLRVVADAGVVLLGRFLGTTAGAARFGSDLHGDLLAADQAAHAFVARIRPFAVEHGATVDRDPPPLVNAWEQSALPPIVTELPLRNVANVLWATGYRPNVRWIDAPIADPAGTPIQRGGVSPVPGLYFMGLHLMMRRGSGFILGVGRDAEDVTAHLHRHLGTSPN